MVQPQQFYMQNSNIKDPKSIHKPSGSSQALPPQLHTKDKHTAQSFFLTTKETTESLSLTVLEGSGQSHKATLHQIHKSFFFFLHNQPRLWLSLPEPVFLCGIGSFFQHLHTSQAPSPAHGTPLLPRKSQTLKMNRLPPRSLTNTHPKISVSSR